MSNPKNIKEASEELSKLESFDVSVFIVSAKASQRFCDFMLALALFCNDLKDIALFNVMGNEFKPENMENATPELAQFYGLMMHIERLYASMVNEFSEFLNKNSDVVSSKEFKEILRLLPKENRECWADLIDILVNKKNLMTSEFKAVLSVIRNNTAFHYSAKEIGLGYSNHFIKLKNEPLLSRGGRIGEIRFYFADAVAQSHFVETIKKRTQSDYNETLNNIMKNIIMSAFIIVEKFINSKSGYKNPTIKNVSEIKFK